MNFRNVLAGAGALAVVSTILSGPATAAPRSSANAPSTAFTVGGQLNGVAAVSGGNAWAVGSTARGKTLIVHWNGTRWRPQVSPNPPGGGTLAAVSAVSRSDAWAVGSTARGKALIVHWNGMRWLRQPAPVVATGANLSGVAALSARNAWAVGGVSTATGSRTLIEHWDGRSWTRVAAPSKGTYATLTSVAALSANSVWAVGTRFTTEGKTLILHWDGSRWASQRSPSPAGNAASLAAVSAGTRSIWAAGCSSCGTGGYAQSLVTRWTGTAWAKSPTPRSTLGNLFGVTSLSGRDAWTVGGHYGQLGNSQSVETLAERWNGITWSVVPTPSPGAESTLRGVSAVSARNAWAVGSYQRTAGDQGSSRTLILHWNGTRWR